MLDIPSYLDSRGVLRLSGDRDDKGVKIIVEVDSGIVQLARKLVPKTVPLRPQRYAPHITVCRNQPIVLHSAAWSAFEGISVDFVYDVAVRWDAEYYWMRVFCPWLQWFRTQAGLEETSKESRPPDGEHCFHITIGNTKG
jgi:hypothetical protein